MSKGLERYLKAEDIAEFQEQEFSNLYSIFCEWIKHYYHFIDICAQNQLFEYYPRMNMYLPKFQPDIVVIGKILDNAHQVCAFSFRRAFLRGMIIGEGLEEYADDIITGMNASCERVFPEMPESKTPQERCSQTDKVSRALLKFGIDYIEKWKMYNNLFGEKNS